MSLLSAAALDGGALSYGEYSNRVRLGRAIWPRVVLCAIGGRDMLLVSPLARTTEVTSHLIPDSTAWGGDGAIQNYGNEIAQTGASRTGSRP